MSEIEKLKEEIRAIGIGVLFRQSLCPFFVPLSFVCALAWSTCKRA